MDSIFQKENVRLKVDAKDAEDAIRKAGKLLVNSGYIKDEFIDAMVDVYKELGGYIVLAPRFALPHARPESGALKTGFSLITLKTPVNFGHRTNDPVEVVIGMAARDNKEHINSLVKIANVMEDQANITKIINSNDVDDVIEIFK